MDDVIQRGHLRLVTEPESTISGDRERTSVPGPTKESLPQLQVIQAGERDVSPQARTADESGTQLNLFSDVVTSGSALLGFFNMYRAWGDSFASLLEQIRPVWIFDLRPSPSFNLIGLDRQRAFSLFRTYGTTYCNLNSMFDLWDRQDPRIASGEIAGELNRIATRPDRPAMRGPIIFLVDEPEVVRVGIDVFPRTLRPRPRGGWQVQHFDNRASQHAWRAGQ